MALDTDFDRKMQQHEERMSEMGMEEAKRKVLERWPDAQIGWIEHAQQPASKISVVAEEGRKLLGFGSTVAAAWINAASRLEPVSAPRLSGATLHLAVLRKQWPDARTWQRDSDWCVTTGSGYGMQEVGTGATELLALRDAAEKVIAADDYTFMPLGDTWLWNNGTGDPVQRCATRDLALDAACRDWLGTGEQPLGPMPPHIQRHMDTLAASMGVSVEEQRRIDAQPTPQPVESAGDRPVFICASWTKRWSGAGHWNVYRCDLPEGHEGDHVDSVLLTNWSEGRPDDTLASTPKPDARVAELERDVRQERRNRDAAAASADDGWSRAEAAEAKSAHLALHVETMRAALTNIASDFETDYVLHGQVVDNPTTTHRLAWDVARKALADTNAGGEEMS